MLLYEFLCGKLPFGQNSEDPFSIYEDILTAPLRFPDNIDPLNENSISFIKQLLAKFPDKRHVGHVEKLKNHLFFAGFEWEKLYTKKLTPPFKPDTEDIFDSFNENSEDFEGWDSLIENDSEESSDDLPDIFDSEIEEYKKTILPDWDEVFS